MEKKKKKRRLKKGGLKKEKNFKTASAGLNSSPVWPHEKAVEKLFGKELNDSLNKKKTLKKRRIKKRKKFITATPGLEVPAPISYFKQTTAGYAAV